jgi:sialic acid synthase SpsE
LDTDIGLSDHTRGTTVSAAAVALGATVIEKHFTLSHDDGGLDAAFSLDAKEFTELVTNAKEIFHSIKNLSDSGETAQKDTRNFRRSLYVTQDIRAGEPFTAENIRSVRPAAGLPPKHYWSVLDAKAACNIKAGEPLDWDMVK